MYALASSPLIYMGVLLIQYDRAIHFLVHDALRSSIRYSWSLPAFNSSSPEQNGRHFADDMVWCIFLNEKLCILINISLKFVAEGQIGNNQALV